MLHRKRMQTGWDRYLGSLQTVRQSSPNTKGCVEHHCLAGAGSQTTKTKTRGEVGLDEKVRVGEVIPSGAGGCKKELFWLPNCVVLDEWVGC